MRLKANLLLLLAAVIWGFAFVAQRVGMDHVGPFTYNGIRFALGSLSLIPLILYFKNNSPHTSSTAHAFPKVLQAGLLAGSVLFLGASFQQVGLLYTTAGKAAFITGLYIVFVPVAGMFLRERIHSATWLGCIFAIAGLFLLCIKESFSISYGDLLELIGAFFWTAHILLIDRFSREVDVLKLAAIQFAACSLLSMGIALLTETITLNGIFQAGIPILYGGICSVGIAYTLQIVGQKNASPAHAAIILSMETVFAAIGGFYLLNERLGFQEIIGCTLMFTGMLLSQMPSINPAKYEQSESQSQ